MRDLRALFLGQGGVLGGALDDDHLALEHAILPVVSLQDDLRVLVEEELRKEAVMDGGEKLLTVREDEPGDGSLCVPLEAIRDQLAVHAYRLSHVGLAVQQLADGKIEDSGALECRVAQVAKRYDQEPHGDNELAPAAKEASGTLSKVGGLLVWNSVLHGTDGCLESYIIPINPSYRTVPSFARR